MLKSFIRNIVKDLDGAVLIDNKILLFGLFLLSVFVGLQIGSRIW